MDFDKLRAKKSVLQRTRPRNDLPKVALYLEWLGGTGQRKVLGPDQQERVLDDKVVQSNYKVATGKKAQALLEEHWPEVAKALAAETPKPAKKS